MFWSAAMTREDLINDLAYARTLAEEGRQAPLLGGSYLIFWGVLNAIAFSAQYALINGFAAELNGAGYAYLWIGYSVIGIAGMIALRVRTRGKPGLSTIGVQAERALWMGAGFAITAIAIGSVSRMLLTQDPTAPNAIFGAAFALYGAALYGTAQLAQQGWLRAYAGLSVLVGGLLCMFANQDWAYLIAAAGSMLVLIAPGIVLVKREPSAIV